MKEYKTFEEALDEVSIELLRHRGCRKSKTVIVKGQKYKIIKTGKFSDNISVYLV